MTLLERLSAAIQARALNNCTIDSAIVVRVMGPSGPAAGILVAFSAVATQDPSRFFTYDQQATTNAMGMAGTKLKDLAQHREEVFSITASLPAFVAVGTTQATFECVTPVISSVEILKGDTIRGLVGNVAPIRPVMRVLDQFGDPYTDQRVPQSDCAVTFADFFVGAGIGPPPGSPYFTFDCGHTGSWVPAPYGLFLPPTVRSGYLQLTVRQQSTARQVTAPPIAIFVDPLPPGSFNLGVAPFGSVPAAVTTAMNAAVARWEGVILGDIPDFNATLPAGNCAGVAMPPTFGFIDDLSVLYATGSIDGPGGTLAWAAPCEVRAGPGRQYPIRGLITFDAADVGTLSAAALQNLAKHELAHALGFGFWDLFPGVADTGQLLPRNGVVQADYVGDAGQGGAWAYGAFPQLWCDLPGFPDPTCRLPEHNGHWSDLIFPNELMAPILRGGSLSKMTINAMRDMGYVVNDAVADTYHPLLQGGPAEAEGTVVDRLPRWSPAVVNNAGFVLSPGRLRSGSGW
ncbi:MAG: leishmanolysin-related zinc metalloendopeptidase [Gemmatimonadota bacterium]|nr:leishmanolysin-related zinc metalloendopeptidase [Gemmatimonadota bacterium]